MDITSQVQTATSTPAEAASNIQNANITGVPATNDKSINEPMAADVHQSMKPTEASPPVADYMSTGTEYAALAIGADPKDPTKSDIPVHNYIADTVKWIGDLVYDRPTDDQKRTTLLNRQMDNDGKLSAEDASDLFDLSQGPSQPPGPPVKPPQLVQLPSGEKIVARPLTPPTAGDMAYNEAGVLKDKTLESLDSMVHGVRHNLPLISAYTGAGGLAGFAGGPFAEVTVPGGLAMGFGLGVRTAFSLDAYDSTRAMIYGNLSNATDKDGKPLVIDENTKKWTAQGAGLVSAALMNVDGGAITKAIPWLNPAVTPAFAKMAMQAPESAVMRLTLQRIGQTMATMGVVGGLQEASNIVAETVGKHYDGTPASILNSLNLAATNLENYKRVGEGVAVGVTTGGVIAGTLGVTGVKATRAQVENIADIGKQAAHAEALRRNSERDVTPGAPEQLNEGTTPTKGGAPGSGTPSAPPENSVQQSVKALKFRDAMTEVNDAIQETQMHKVAPNETAGLMQKVFDHAGVQKVWTTIQAMRNWATSPEKGEAARNLMDKSGMLAANSMNAPVEVDPVQVVEMAKNDPSIWDHIKLTPQGPTPLQAEAHLENIQKAHEARAEVMTKLGIEPKDVVPEPTAPDNVVPIGTKTKEEKQPFNLEKATNDVDAHLKEIAKLKDQLANFDNFEKPRNPEDLIDPSVKAHRETRLQVLNGEIDVHQKFIDEIKQQVTEHLKGQTPGDLLIPQFGHWPEPGLDDANDAAQGYLDQHSIPDAIKKVLPKAETEKLEAATRAARQENMDSIREAAYHEMNQVQDQMVEMTKEARLEQEREAIANDPNYEVIDRIRTKYPDQIDENGKKIKGQSIYAIDPKTLSSGLFKYVDDPLVKASKIFQKGGGNADEVANALGLQDAEALLKVIATTAPREQVIKARTAASAVADEEEARGSVDLNHTRIVETINNQSANLAAEMKFMREQEWPALKGAITRIALPPSSVEEWTQRGRDIVKDTKVGSLSENVFRVAERQSHRAAVKAILKGQFPLAYEEMGKRGVALAALKEALIKTAEINKAQRFMRKFANKDTRAVLKLAGPTIFNASEEINQLFDYSNPNRANQTATGAYLKWATREVKAGRGDFSIPEKFSDIRENFKDLTVEQALTIADRAKVLFKVAKEKGETKDALDKIKEKRAMDRFVADVKQKALEHPGSKSSRIPELQAKEKTPVEAVKGFFASTEELIATKQNIYRELDVGNTGGFFYNEFDAAMEGSGKYFEKSGHTYVKKWNKWLDENIKRMAKTHGDMGSFERKVLTIPEFAGIKELNFGRLTKGDLMTAAANRGQQYTKDMLRENNGGVTDAVWEKVLNREISKKDADFVQSTVDLYKDPALRAKTVELQKNQGRDIEFIEGIPWSHTPEGGKTTVYPGGYIRVRTVHSYSDAELKQALELHEGKGAAHFEKANGADWGRQYAAETTNQGYLIARVGNSEPVKLELSTLFDGLREIIHDHAYREPLMDFMSKMKNKEVKSALTAMVGEKKVDTLISTNLEIAGRPSSRDSGFFANPNRNIKNLIGKAGNKFAAYTIFANLHATMIQAEAIPQLFNALGPKSMIHFADVVLTMTMNPDKLWGFIESAGKMDPSISKYIDFVGDNTMNVLDDIVPKKGKMNRLQKSLIGKGHDYLTILGYLPHQMADLFLKVAGAHTVMKHVLAGDHPLYPLEKIQAMTPEEQYQVIQGIVQQTSTLVQIQNRHELKAPIQKNVAVAPWVPFWNYPRNIVNNFLLDNRKALWKTKEGMAKLTASGGAGGGGRSVNDMSTGNYDDGGSGRDYKGAAKDFASATGMALTSTAWRVIGGLFLAYIAGKTVKFTKDQIDWSDPKDVAEAGLDVAGTMMEAQADYLIHSTPLASSMEFAADNKRKYKMADVKNPQTQQLSSLTTCLQAIPDFLSLSRGTDRMQRRACLEMSGAIFSPVVAKTFKMSMDWENSHSMPALPDNFHVQFSTAQVDKAQKEIADFVKDPGEAPKDLVAQAEALHKQLVPETVKIPEKAADTIKLAESGGKWDGENGLYGFTSSDWKGIMRSAPELGLTENGRTAKDTTQQEKAIDWSLHQNASSLGQRDLPVNNLTLFGAHTMGVENYAKVYNASADTKIKAVLGADAFKDHPELQSFKTIGQVKSYLYGKVEESRKALDDNALTSKTSKNED